MKRPDFDININCEECESCCECVNFAHYFYITPYLYEDANMWILVQPRHFDFLKHVPEIVHFENKNIEKTLKIAVNSFCIVIIISIVLMVISIIYGGFTGWIISMIPVSLFSYIAFQVICEIVNSTTLLHVTFKNSEDSTLNKLFDIGPLLTDMTSKKRVAKTLWMLYKGKVQVSNLKGNPNLEDRYKLSRYFSKLIKKNNITILAFDTSNNSHIQCHLL